MTRRDLVSLVPVLAAAAPEPRQGLPPHSTVFSFENLPAHASAGGGVTTRPVLRGKLPTGEFIELHETTLMPGQMPHPAHRHTHTELMLIREGMLEFILDGKPEHLGPGGVAYAASGELHALKNVGSVAANYFVIAIGSEQE